MYLLDKPYVSDFLLETIKKHNGQVIATKEAKELAQGNALNWISEHEAYKSIKNNPQQPLYSNSENALRWIEDNFQSSELSNQINTLKDKAVFREQIKAIFPDFKFHKISVQDIQKISHEDLSFPFVIKPSVGFLSIGVYIIKGENDWLNAQRELKPEKLKSIFPKNVLDTSYFIIEDFIQGEEYAIDYYHNDQGEVVILNILHHVFSSVSDTSDRLYSTSKKIVARYKTQLAEFLAEIGGQLNLRNFPAHAEVRIDENGKIVPIEINPMRFGGWCTTADLSGVALGFNIYQCYCENTTPDWDVIYQGKEDKIFSLIVLDNSTGLDPENIAKFDYQALANDCEKPVLIRPLDINKYPLFGFVFLETSPGQEQLLNRILNSNLSEYISIRE